MKFLICSLVSIASFFTTSIYSFKVNSIDNGTINFNSLHGKKIMLVNIATSSDKVGQLAQLELLYKQYKDSFVIIGFPSNSFGHESRSNSEIKAFCSSIHGVTFPLAAKGNVGGVGIQPIYHWLTHKTENGTVEGEIKDDFQKYIINKDGELIGVFAGNVTPSHPGIIQAITGN